MTRIGIIGLGYVDIRAVVAHAQLLVDLRNAVRQTLNGSPSGEAPPNVTVL